MDLTPQTGRSSKSPRFSHQPLFNYPSPAQSDSRFRSTDSLQGLGIFTDTMVGTSLESGSLGAQDQSNAATNNCWAPAALEQRNIPASSNSTPNILSAEYDPFAPFHSSTSSFSHDIYSTHSAQIVALPVSPLLSGNTSQRSSFSSAPASEIFTQAGSIHSFTPQIKMEEPTDFSTGSDSLILSPPPLHNGLLINSTNSYHGTLDTSYYQDQAPMGWGKIEYSNTQELPSISSLPIPQYNRRSESQETPSLNSQPQRRTSSVVARTRQPRKLTTKEDANFTCHVKGCGKLFGRSYNFKAHLETHDAAREYPFPCTVNDCNKKFVRKTDLQRHHQSVHMKQRNYRCDYCSRQFARKDTLRRHMEDGCSKRFDIETVDFRPQNLNHSDNNALRISSLPAASHSKISSYSSPQFSPPSNNPMSLSSHHGPTIGDQYIERHNYLGQAEGHGSTWPH